MGKIKKGIKMAVNPEQSRKVQEICFENGMEWVRGNQVKHLNKPFIFINNSGSICHGRTSQLFNIDKNEEVSAELFIRTNGTCVESETLAEDIPPKESQPKTLSEYLKENNAYEAFIENCVARALLNPKSFEGKRGKAEDIDDFFTWDKTKEGHYYWYNLHINQPKPIEYDMNEIIFAEVDKRIAEQKAQSEFISTEEFDQMFEQKTSTKYMVFVEGRSNPKKVHDSYASAEKEAKRLSTKEIGCNVRVLSVVKTFKSKVIVKEV